MKKVHASKQRALSRICAFILIGTIEDTRNKKNGKTA